MNLLLTDVPIALTEARITMLMPVAISAVFDGGRAGLVGDESQNQLPHLMLPLTSGAG